MLAHVLPGSGGDQCFGEKEGFNQVTGTNAATIDQVLDLEVLDGTPTIRNSVLTGTFTTCV